MVGTHPLIPPQEIYDIIVYDNFTIRITIITTPRGNNFYKKENLEFYNNEDNKVIDGIPVKQKYILFLISFSQLSPCPVLTPTLLLGEKLS